MKLAILISLIFLLSSCAAAPTPAVKYNQSQVIALALNSNFCEVDSDCSEVRYAHSLCECGLAINQTKIEKIQRAIENLSESCPLHLSCAGIRELKCVQRKCEIVWENQ